MSLSTRPRHVPLLWILVPFATGIALAGSVSPALTPLLLGIAASASLTAYLASKRNAALWHLALVAAVLCAGMLRYHSLPAAQAQVDSFPPREATLDLRITRLFDSSNPDIHLGLAETLHAPAYLSQLAGHRIYFALESSPDGPPPLEGETVRTFGVARPLVERDDKSRFIDYLKHQGVTATIKQGFIKSRLRAASPFRRYLLLAQNKLSSVLENNRRPDSPYSGAYKALMLGKKGELSEEQKNLFLANGAMHLFAISGLHIGVIAICIHHFLLVFRIKGAALPVFSLVLILCFVLVTGGSASSWRALLMIACLYLSHGSQRQSSPVSALALSAIIYLFILPNQLFQAGFQMSYLTVASILLFGLPMAKTLNRISPLFSQIPRSAQSMFQKAAVVSKTWLLNSFAISLSAYIASSILGLLYFEILPVYGVFTNLIALPLASLAIVSGFLSLILSPLTPILPLSELFNNAALLIIKIIHGCLSLTEKLPFATLAPSHLRDLLILPAFLTIFLLMAFAYSRTGGSKSALRWQTTPLLATAAAIYFCFF
ncbi:ComEC/Rec2 family competence protein [Pelagicoccus sp. SDUM812003]|uniref:ComEC/Rec2 family competence protein n=1 Tax=Pelagicoccus sp. SDUM812003 TaxID=3041267 RepID=UPI00280E2C45|nr:ComEC/Rec2 family competence protein [Pelagicoccus sp. SDUM812003]MDQ8202659.1 ComEC/Rec2 family competence protein [Pelagicoccus sp. SDUM812003]